jgi:hypothetical protein
LASLLNFYIYLDLRLKIIIVSAFFTLATFCTVYSQTVSASLLDGLFGSGVKTYENSTYNVKVDYPSDWKYENSEIEKDTQPETVFQVMFFSPYESGNSDKSASVSVSVDSLQASTTLDQYKNRIMKNLNEAVKDVKDISIRPTVLDGEQAYRIEHDIWLLDHWEKSITLYSVKNGKLHEISALGKPEGMQRYLQSIENMFKSVSFH